MCTPASGDQRLSWVPSSVALRLMLCGKDSPQPWSLLIQLMASKLQRSPASASPGLGLWVLRTCAAPSKELRE